MNWSFLNSPDFVLLKPFLISLGIGILLGVERERNPASRAGMRTYALTALLGSCAGLLAERLQSAWIIAAALIAIGAMIIVANARHPDEDGDPGTTSVVALLLCFGFGVMVWLAYVSLAVTLAIITTILLYFKGQLHRFSHNLTQRDLISILQFAVLALVILPVLPNHDFGPYEALNLRQIWWMVVLISGVSLAGYAALRIFGQKHGAPLLGFLGGLVSSTATTLVFSRHAKQSPELLPLSMVVILTANIMVMIRLSVLTAVVAPAVLYDLLPILGGGLLAGAGWVIIGWRRLGATDGLPELEIHNPTEMRTALTFGVAYALILFFAAWLGDIAGSAGVYVVSLVSGLTDVDAITLSSLHLFGINKLSAHQAATSIFLAVIANLVFKTSLTISVGGKQVAGKTAPGLAAIGAGSLAGWALALM